VKLALCVPSRTELPEAFHEMIAQHLGDVACTLFSVVGEPVVEARNELAARALASGAELALWLDDDAYPEAGSIERLLATMRAQPAIDMLAAFACDRRPFCSPNAFRLHGERYVALAERNTPAPFAIPEWAPRYSIGDVVPVDACAFHCVLMRTTLLERLGADPFVLPRDARYGEDFEFCRRARAVGASLAVDTGAPVAHLEPESGLAFLPYKPPGRIVERRFFAIPDTRSAAEIAAPWRDRDTRADRSYGGALDGIFRAAHARRTRGAGKPNIQ